MALLFLGLSRRSGVIGNSSAILDAWSLKVGSVGLYYFLLGRFCLKLKNRALCRLGIHRAVRDTERPLEVPALKPKILSCTASNPFRSGLDFGRWAGSARSCAIIATSSRRPTLIPRCLTRCWRLIAGRRKTSGLHARPSLVENAASCMHEQLLKAVCIWVYINR